MFGSTPESGKAKLCVGVHGRFFENTLSGMEKLTDERVVLSRGCHSCTRAEVQDNDSRLARQKGE